MNDAIGENVQICLTSINVYEFLKGLRYKSNKEDEQTFENFLKCITVFHLNDDSVKMAAEIYANIRKHGIPVGDADILIAAVVITNGGKHVTNNTKHYKNIGNLIIENWYS